MEHLFFFKEETVEVGQECHGFCASCKQDTPHTVVTRFEREIRSVQCLICSSTHAYRPPRGEAEDDVLEPISIRRRQTSKKVPWTAALKEFWPVEIRPYSPREDYQVNDVVDHPIFGEGYVSQLVSDTKLELIFQDGERILAYNRPDLPAPTGKVNKRRPVFPRPELPLVAEKGSSAKGRGKNGARSKGRNEGRLTTRGRPRVRSEEADVADSVAEQLESTKRTVAKNIAVTKAIAKRRAATATGAASRNPKGAKQAKAAKKKATKKKATKKKATKKKATKKKATKKKATKKKAAKKKATKKKATKKKATKKKAAKKKATKKKATKKKATKKKAAKKKAAKKKAAKKKAAKKKATKKKAAKKKARGRRR